MRFRTPRWLAPGSHVRLVAPSSPFEREAFENGVLRLRTRYRVSFDESIFEQRHYLAGADERRLAELDDALRDASVDGIVCARGGYGMTRLLPKLDPACLRKAGPLLVGFSDITALHAFFARAGLGSVHGAMGAALGRMSPARLERWFDAVEGRPVSSHRGLSTIASGVAEGPLVGGNLSVLAALVGTPFEPPLDGTILVLEDVGEAPYRLDRMLTTLAQAGWFRRVAGVVLGSFTHCGPGARGAPTAWTLAERLRDIGKPVASGLQVGHHEDDLELPLGRCARLDSEVGSLVLLPD